METQYSDLQERVKLLEAEIKRQESEIKQYKAQNKQLVDILFPDFIFVFDADFVFADIILPEGLRLFHDKDEVIGTSGRDLYSPEVSDLIHANIKECLRTNKMKEIEYHLDLFGVRYYYQAKIVPMPGNLVFCLIHDIGERIRRMDELLASRRKAEEADRLKSAFLANMSHEIRTPLNAIIGFTEIVLNEDDKDLKEEYMKIIRTNNDLLLQLINDILDLSRIESGKTEIRFEFTNIKDLLSDVEKTQDLRMSPDVTLTVEQIDESIFTYTDAARVKQILFNFLSNAVKHTSKGSINLKLTVESDYLKFSVTDTGKGIPEDKLTTIFDRFEKVDSFVQGTGLGLSIAQGLVERLGGEIGVDSVLGEGSTFWFTIPYRKDLPEITQPKDRIGDIKDLYSTGIIKSKILIVEDSQEAFDTVNEVLGDKYDVIWAPDGESAISAFVLENPSLLLVSMQLPAMSGIDVVKKIRTMSQSIPIIGVTSNDFYIEQKWAMESGCNDVISKPYSALKLEEVATIFIKAR